MTYELPKRRIAGVEYLSCEWCGEPVSQLGSWSPRRHCKRSHRQRAFEARRLGLPMKRNRGKKEEPAVQAAVAVVAPVPPAPPSTPPLWEDEDIAVRLARYGIGSDGQELPGTQPGGPPARDA